PFRQRADRPPDYDHLTEDQNNSQATGVPRSAARRNGRPSTAPIASGGSPPAGRIERTLASVARSPARTSATTYSERRKRSPSHSAGRGPIRAEPSACQARSVSSTRALS